MFSTKYLIRLVFFRTRDNILTNTDLYWIILINSYFNILTSSYQNIKIWRCNEQILIVLTLSNALTLILRSGRSKKMYIMLFFLAGWLSLILCKCLAFDSSPFRVVFASHFCSDITNREWYNRQLKRRTTKMLRKPNESTIEWKDNYRPI